MHKNHFEAALRFEGNVNLIEPITGAWPRMLALERGSGWQAYLEQNSQSIGWGQT
jgi:hypothetical protein